MPKQWRRLLERLESEDQRREEWEEEHPPITRLSPEDADAQRTIKPVGEKAVTCNLPCHGNNVPEKYSHIGQMVNVFNNGMRVEGWEGMYMGLTCNLTDGKVCVATDERLRKSAERRSVER